MSLSAKQLKEMENKVHHNLHGNLKLLTHLYPTTKEFDSVFKENMFQKSNKAAFQHVIYYLFTVLDPQLTAEKIKSWPLYDVKLEGVFRTEVASCIRCINSKYEDANFPNLIASQLVTPGGLKFARFMLELSNFVIYEHLKRKEELKSELLSPIRNCKNPVATKIMLKTLRLKTASVESQVNDKQKEFQATHEILVNEAQAIISEQTQLELDLATARIMLKEKKCKGCPESVQSLTERFDSLQPQMAQLEKYKSMCEEGSSLLEYLSSEKPILQFKKDELRIPDSVKHLLNVNDDELDLCCLFSSLAVLLENENLEMPILTYGALEPLIKTVSELNERSSHLAQKFDAHLNDLVESSEGFSQRMDRRASRRVRSLKTTSTSPRNDAAI